MHLFKFLLTYTLDTGSSPALPYPGLEHRVISEHVIVVCRRMLIQEKGRVKEVGNRKPT